MSSIKQKLVLLSIATCGFIIFDSPSEASVIFNQSQTGADLFSNPNVTFPTTAPVLGVDSISFGSGNKYDALMIWDLLPAGSRGDLNFTIEIDYTALTSDNDPIFSIFDGTNYSGLIRWDNNGGGVQTISGSATTTEVSSTTFDGVVASSIGLSPFSFDLSIDDGGAGPASLSNFVQGGVSETGPFVYQGNFIDTDKPLSFALYRDDGPEQYRINSVEITIQEEATANIPEPSMMLGLLTIGGIALGASKKKES